MRLGGTVFQVPMGFSAELQGSENAEAPAGGDALTDRGKTVPLECLHSYSLRSTAGNEMVCAEIFSRSAWQLGAISPA